MVEIFFLCSVCIGFFVFFIFCFKGVVLGLGKEVFIMLVIEVGFLVSFIGEIFFLLFNMKDVNEVLGNLVFCLSFIFIGVVFDILREFVLVYVLVFVWLVCLFVNY